MGPHLCSRLWSELDVVPIVFKDTSIMDLSVPAKSVDELADSVARKVLA